MLPNSYSTTPEPQADTSQSPNYHSADQRGSRSPGQHGQRKHSHFKLLLNRSCVDHGNKWGTASSSRHTVNTHPAVLLRLAFVPDGICLAWGNLFYFLSSLHEWLTLSYVKRMFSDISINGLQLDHVLLSYQFIEAFLATLFIEHLGLPFTVVLSRVGWSASNLPRPPQAPAPGRAPARRLESPAFIFTHTGVGL